MAPLRRLLLFAGPLFAVVVACTPVDARTEIEPEGKVVEGGTNPECPHAPMRGSPLGALAGYRTGIPEFHDCQRLIVKQNGRLIFGPLVAIFAVDTLDRIADTAFVSPRNVGILYNRDEEFYEPLNFRDRYNCLVLRRDSGRMRAWLVPRTTPAQCLDQVPAGQLVSARELRVTPYAAANGMPAADVPPVARWDWDEKTETQFIGIRCGSRWCEIGRKPGFTTSPRYDGSALTAPKLKRNVTNKGWYDEQRLAEFRSPKATPMPGFGTVIPSADLEAFSRGPLVQGLWVEVAQVHVRPDAGDYRASFNFVGENAPPPTSARSRVFICAGTSATCAPTDATKKFTATACTPEAGVRWYARIESPTDPVRYFCVLFNRHPAGFHIPPVVRWRWRENDETIWVSCPSGCCEVNAKRT